MHHEFATVYPTADGLRVDFQTRRHFRDRKKRWEGRGKLFGHLYETFYCSSISRAAWRARRRARSRSAAESAGARARYFAPGSPASLIFVEFSAISFPCIQQGPELLREFGEYRFLFYGLVIVIMMRLKPEGLWPSAARRREMLVDQETEEFI